jgi:hypothetical protein
MTAHVLVTGTLFRQSAAEPFRDSYLEGGASQ